MSTSIDLGGYGSLELNSSVGNVARADRISSRAAVDVVGVVKAALESPRSFPTLAAALVPGDRVAIAVGDHIPQAADVVRGALQAFERAGVEPSLIDVVLADSADAAVLDGTLGEARVAVHTPSDASQLCFVGLTAAGRELRINRRLFEADFVLPLTCARHSDEHDARGAFQGLFPRFADEETIRRFRQLEVWTSAARKRELLKETAEAGWLIGAPLVVEVVPDRGNRVAAVIAGDPSAVAGEAQRECASIWKAEFKEPASLVVAVIGGDRREQSWDNLGRALAAAGNVIGEGGAVALVCGVSGRIGKSISRLIGADDRRVVARKLAGDTSDDNWCAWELIQALERGPVYLLSVLEADLVEELGVAPIANKDELARLIGRHQSCIVLEDAQHVVASLV
jgi:hypothetical protein